MTPSQSSSQPLHSSGIGTPVGLQAGHMVVAQQEPATKGVQSSTTPLQSSSWPLQPCAVSARAQMA